MLRAICVLARATLLLFVIAIVPVGIAADVRPNADEECVMRCDEQSDQCMTKVGNDEQKAKACDDQYAECLQKCR